MSWERYGCQKDCTDFPDGCINADLFSSMAEAMVAKVSKRELHWHARSTLYGERKSKFGRLDAHGVDTRA